MSRSSSEKTGDSALNRRLAWVFAALAALHLFGLPLLLHRDPAWGWLLLPIVLASNSLWAFIHEAVHGVMFTDKGANRAVGRALSVAFGASFDLLRWGHLLHHAHSRTRRERSEVYAGARPTAGFVVAYYLRILGGLYFAEVVASLLMLLPRAWIAIAGRRLASDDNVIEALVERMLAPQTLRAARVDALALLCVHGSALWLYGEHAWMYLASLAGRGLLISFVDNVFHYGTALDRPRAAMNLSLASPLSMLILHFNLHGAHHLRPQVPWHRLPALHREQGTGFQDRWWPALFRQLRGPMAEARLLVQPNCHLPEILSA